MILIFLTIGVWSERTIEKLHPRHLVFFFLDLTCDSFGTGLIAINLMLILAAWSILLTSYFNPMVLPSRTHRKDTYF